MAVWDGSAQAPAIRGHFNHLWGTPLSAAASASVAFSYSWRKLKSDNACCPVTNHNSRVWPLLIWRARWLLQGFDSLTDDEKDPGRQLWPRVRLSPCWYAPCALFSRSSSSHQSKLHSAWIANFNLSTRIKPMKLKESVKCCLPPLSISPVPQIVRP